MNGIITNISMGGAAVRFALFMEKPPKLGIPISLYLRGIGEFPGRVLRSYDNGFAVAFKPHKTWDKQLIAKLKAVLPDDDEEGA